MTHYRQKFRLCLIRRRGDAVGDPQLAYRALTFRGRSSKNEERRSSDPGKNL